LGPLLAEEKEAWARYLKWDYRPVLEIIGRMLESRSLPGYVALLGGRPAAYTYFWMQNDIGMLGGCFVPASFAGQKLEEILLAEGVKTLEAYPGIRRIEAQFMSFQSWDAETFFCQRKFKDYPRYFMLCDNLGEAKHPPAGIRIKRWENEDLKAGAQLTIAAYERLADRQISAHYQSESSCHEFLSNIILRPGCGNFLGEASFVAWDEKSRQMAGYVLASMISPKNGHVPQIAVAPQFQGKGIGKILLLETLATLKKKQFQSVSLSVTAENRKAVQFYRKYHFDVIKPFNAFVWEKEN
jgi:ribosomal protein S18 acetylase RimI-like enzyme